MYRIVIEVDEDECDEQGLKEQLAMDFEKYGDVRVVRVEHVRPEQLRMEARGS